MSDRESALEAELKGGAHVKTRYCSRKKIDALIRLVYRAKERALSIPTSSRFWRDSRHKKADAPAADDEPAAGAPKKAPPRSPKARGPRLPEHLAGDARRCSTPTKLKGRSPGAWRQIGEEVTEQLDYEPARFLKRRHGPPHVRPCSINPYAPPRDRAAAGRACRSAAWPRPD
jgi:hypothetical protein